MNENQKPTLGWLVRRLDKAIRDFNRLKDSEDVLQNVRSQMSARSSDDFDRAVQDAKNCVANEIINLLRIALETFETHKGNQ